MKTEQQWMEHFALEPMTDRDDGVRLKTGEIKAIQDDAFECGRLAGLEQGVSIAQGRLIPQKNEGYQRAIEAVSIFLKAEIERTKRGETDSNVTT